MNNIITVLHDNWRQLPDWVKKTLVAVLIILVGFMSYRYLAGDRLINGISVAGIRVGGMKLAVAERLLVKNIKIMSNRKVVLDYQNQEYTLNLESLGSKLDAGATIKAANRIGREGPIWTRVATRWRVFWSGRDLRPVYKHNPVILNSFYRMLEQVINIEPAEASVRVSRSGQVLVTPSKLGRRINFKLLTVGLEETMFNPRLERIKLPVKTALPVLTDLEIKEWGLDRPLGYYTTRFDAKLQDRVHNLETASKAIHNVLIKPGQKFSFNARVGPRVSETGYREAPVVLFNKLVPGIGGGVCQVSTTLYNAVLYANLPVVQRTSHSMPSAYVPLARDATVVDEWIDFQFENDLKTPILLAAVVNPPYLTVAVLGKKVGWEKVSLESVIVKTYPFEVKDVLDPELPLGERVKDLDGKKGYLVELWRTVQLQGGKILKRRENVSIYPPQPEEYKIGTKKVTEDNIPD